MLASVMEEAAATQITTDRIRTHDTRKLLRIDPFLGGPCANKHIMLTLPPGQEPHPESGAWGFVTRGVFPLTARPVTSTSAMSDKGREKKSMLPSPQCRASGQFRLAVDGRNSLFQPS